SEKDIQEFRDKYLDKLSRFNPAEHNTNEPSKYYVTISFEYLVSLHDLISEVGQIILDPGRGFKCENKTGIDGHITIYDDWME
ncbi:MAG: hypothetical protein VZR95_10135, partial [Alphaproteobacteria bacterium]